ncbi:DNA methylase [Salinicola salarius]|uniref:DNA methylase n=1 Tax=Salinicola salarius TaxID=430457 RepID=UPI0013004199|nr:DNA methylase [Salinicola salarius]
MANSPAHKFGQTIGYLLEEIVAMRLSDFCRSRCLYLDRQGYRAARKGKKITFSDLFDNSHDLDFVIERDGTEHSCGEPVAFIEVAWRRYTKHSRNKVQEIQGAILPVAEKHRRSKPFVGAVLAGVFTEGALAQLKSNGFSVLYFPYEKITKAFLDMGLDINFNEKTSDIEFAKANVFIESMLDFDRQKLIREFIEEAREDINDFIRELSNVLDRQMKSIFIIPLHGKERFFDNIDDALEFLYSYDVNQSIQGEMLGYKVLVEFSNGDKIDGEFYSKADVVSFIDFVASRR